MNFPLLSFFSQILNSEDDFEAARVSERLYKLVHESSDNLWVRRPYHGSSIEHFDDFSTCPVWDFQIKISMHKVSKKLCANYFVLVLEHGRIWASCFILFCIAFLLHGKQLFKNLIVMQEPFFLQDIFSFHKKIWGETGCIIWSPKTLRIFLRPTGVYTIVSLFAVQFIRIHVCNL